VAALVSMVDVVLTVVLADRLLHFMSNSFGHETAGFSSLCPNLSQRITESSAILNLNAP